jgi:hypothetical protein
MADAISVDLRLPFANLRPAPPPARPPHPAGPGIHVRARAALPAHAPPPAPAHGSAPPAILGRLRACSLVQGLRSFLMARR